jgi:hypothetical protein
MYACLQKAKCDEGPSSMLVFVQGPIFYHKIFNYFRALHDIIVLLRITPAAR